MELIVISIVLIAVFYRSWKIKHRKAEFLKAITISTLVYSIFAIGYWVYTDFNGFFYDPDRRMFNFIGYIFIPICFLAISKYLRGKEIDFSSKYLVAYIALVAVSFYFSGTTKYNIESLLISIWFLSILGFASSFLGPIMLSINIATLLINYSGVNIGIQELSIIWDSIFEILEVSSGLIKIMVIVISSLLSLRESVVMLTGE